MAKQQVHKYANILTQPLGEQMNAYMHAYMRADRHPQYHHFKQRELKWDAHAEISGYPDTYNKREWKAIFGAAFIIVTAISRQPPR